MDNGILAARVVHGMGWLFYGIGGLTEYRVCGTREHVYIKC